MYAVRSADGTEIAFETVGAGPVVIMVGGMFCYRHSFRRWAEAMSSGLTVVTYDRRGRGDSGDAGAYSIVREIEDLAAVLAAVGGCASVYGHSSGAGLALEAAASGLPVERLVLHDPPYGTDDAESVRQSRELAHTIDEALRDGRPSDAISAFLRASGAPPERAEQMARSPGLLKVAHTMPYDMAVMGNADRGRIVPVELASRVNVPTFLLVGERSAPLFHAAVERLAAVMRSASVAVLEGVGHEAGADQVARAARAFLAGVPE